MSKKPVDSRTHLTNCKCPKCGAEHKAMTEYVGKEPRWQYCENCEKLSKTIMEVEEYILYAN